jgi:hypothetical protein
VALAGAPAVAIKGMYYQVLLACHPQKQQAKYAQQTSAAPLVLIINNFLQKRFTAGNDETSISFMRKGQKVLYHREDKKNKEAKAEKITFRVGKTILISG